jgi:hypothetical protein
MSVQASALALAWVAILLLSFALAGLYRQIRILSRSRYHLGPIGPVRGTAAPSLGDYFTEHSGMRLLLFVDSTCSSCRVALEEADRLGGVSPHPTLMAVFDGATNGYQSDNMVVIPDAHDAFAEYDVQVRPFAVLVDAAGLIVAAQPVGSREALRRFVDEAQARELVH